MKELSLYILDISQNSIRAGANLIELEIIEDLKCDELIIRIKDNGKGMDKETLKKACDPFFTTRRSRRVGLGISLFKANAEMCEGWLRINSELGLGTEVVTLFKHSHIDRPPLGNMADTIMAMAMALGNGDLLYKHVYNSQEFVFNTQKIRNILGELPMGNPKVIMWIKKYVTEGLLEICDED